MSLRLRSALIVAISTALLLAGIFFLANSIVLREHNHLEETRATINLERVIEALRSRLDAIDVMARDWSAWDDMYNYTITKDEEFRKGNLMPSQLLNTSRDVLIVLGKDKEVLCALKLSYKLPEVVPIKQSTLKKIEESGVFEHKHEDSVYKGIIEIEEGILLLASRPIIPSSTEGEIRGTLIFGDFLNDKFFSSLGVSTRSELSFIPLEKISEGNEASAVSVMFNDNQVNATQVLNEDEVAAYHLISDINGKSLGVLRAVYPRSIYHQAKRTMSLILGSLVLCGFAFIGIVSLMIERTVLMRLFRLQRAVSEIGKAGNVGERILVAGNDELSRLTEEVNTMLQELEARQKDIEKQKTELEEAQLVLQSKNAELVASHADLDNAHRTMQITSYRFKQLFDGLPIACFTFDENGLIYEWNKEFESLYHIDAKNTLMKPLWESIYSPEDRDKLVKIVSHVFSGQAIRDEEILTFDNEGREIYILSSIFPMFGLDGKVSGAICASVDITARKKAEQEVLLLAEQLKHAHEIANIGALTLNVNTLEISLSQEAIKLLGEKGSYPNGFKMHYSDFVSSYVCSEDSQVFRRKIDNALMHARDNNYIVDFDFRITRRDGSSGVIHARLLSHNDTILFGVLQDITERKQMESALRESETRMRSIVDTAADAIIVINSQGIIESFNPAGLEMFGYEREEVIGKNVSMLMPEPHKSQHDSYINRYKETGEAKIIGIGREAFAMRKDGSLFPVELAVSEMKTGNTVRYAGIVRDITERRKLQDEVQKQVEKLKKTNAILNRQRLQLKEANTVLETMATTDGLTRLKNHRTFQEFINQEFIRARETGDALSVMLLDIDHFKQYNDTFGHIAGDDVLKKVAKILMQNARGTDFVARYGGEEFVVVLPYTDAEFATKAAERFRKAIEKSKWTNRAITASIGVSTLTEEIQNTATLIHAADQALYHSKASGRNRVTHCSEIEIQSIESDPNSNYYLIDSDKERIRLEATAVIFKQLLSQFSLIRERLHASEEVQNLSDTALMLESENYNLDKWLKSKAYEDFASMNELKNLKEFNKKLQKLMYEYQDASETVNHESFRKVKDEFAKMVFHVLECLSVLQANCESRIDANNKAA